MKNMFKALVAAGVLTGLFVAVLWFLPSDNIGDYGDLPDDPGMGDTPTVEVRDGAKRDIKEVITGNIDMRGIVKDESGQPLSGASVQAYAIDAGNKIADPEQVRAGESDEDGKFHFVGLAAGHYRVTARLKGFQQARKNITLVIKMEPEPVELVMVAGLTISGTVRDQHQRPIAGARVLAFEERVAQGADQISQILVLTEYEDIKEEPGVEATSDETGRYELIGLKNGDYRLLATASGFAPERMNYVRVGRTDADFTLEQGGVLKGVVMDRLNAVVPGAVLSIREAPTGNEPIHETVLLAIRPPLAEVKSNDAGEFVFDQLDRTREYQLVINALGYQPQQMEKVVTSVDDELVVMLQQGLAIRGTVFDPEGNPLEGVTLKATPQGASRRGALLDMQSNAVTTDEAGMFIFDTLEDLQYRISASHDDYAIWKSNRVQPSDGAMEIHLTPGAAVEGVVLDMLTGKGIPGATISVHTGTDSDKVVIADADGHYYMRGVTVSRRGTAVFAFRAEGYSTLGNQKIDVDDGKITEDVIAELEPNGIVHGVVVDPGGNPLGGVRMQVMRQHSPDMPVVVGASKTRESNPDGTFSLRDVRAGEGCVLQGRHPDFLESRSDPFSVEPGQAVSDVRLTMRLGGGVEGSVVDAGSGLAIRGATVEVVGSGGSMLPKSAKTDTDGKFTLPSLTPGDITLRVAAPAYLDREFANIVVEDGFTTPLQPFALTPGAFIAGIVTTVDGRPVARAKLTVIDTSEGLRKEYTSTNSAGEYKVDNLGPYPVDVEVEARGYSKARLSEQPVYRDDIDVQLERYGAISGRVIDENGEGLTAFSVSPKVFHHDRLVAMVPSKTFKSSDGTFTFKGLMPGRYEVSFGSPGYSYEKMHNVYVESDQTVQVRDIVLESGGKVSGYVYDKETGEPIFLAGVQVIGRSSKVGARTSANTDENGYFELRGLEKRSARIKIFKDGYVDETRRVPSGNREITVELSAGGSLRGFVYNVEGEPVPGQQLLITPVKRGGKGQRAVTYDDGSYVFSNLPVGKFRLRVTDFGSRGRRGSRGSEAGFDEMTRAEEERRKDRARQLSQPGAARAERERLAEEMKGMTPEERQDHIKRYRELERAERGDTGSARNRRAQTFTVEVYAGEMTSFDVRLAE